MKKAETIFNWCIVLLICFGIFKIGSCAYKAEKRSTARIRAKWATPEYKQTHPKDGEVVTLPDGTKVTVVKNCFWATNKYVVRYPDGTLSQIRGIELKKKEQYHD